MNTTNLFVELIVIGAGAFFWILLFTLSLFGYNWLPWEKVTASPAILLPLLTVTYVLGIVVDRLADSLFSKRDKKLRYTHGFSSNDEYHIARNHVYTHAVDKIIALSEYGRSRLRISRAWSINFVMLVLNSLVLVWTRLTNLPQSTRWVISIFCIVMFGFGAATTFSAWRKLAINDYKRLKETYVFLASKQ
ncbi:MAG: hypothetical protein KME18_09325 [Phormidium tanganyikae FI6-MK23]|nr:hypothetical protein [Phormidium tanganyikae FI6-MK23]